MNSGAVAPREEGKMEDLQEKIVLLLMDNDVNESGSENYIDTASKIISLIAKTAGGAEVPCSGVLSDFVSLADEFEREGAFLDTPTGYSADKAAGQAYKECANKIRELIEKTKGR